MTPMLRVAVAVLACATLIVAAPASSETREWDQAAVTALAGQLAGAAGDLRSSVQRAPRPASRRQQRARFLALEDLRVVEGSINSLHRQLESGADQAETYPTYRRIALLRRNVAQNARRALITEPTLGKLETARGILDQMAPFYAAEVAADEEIEAID